MTKLCCGGDTDGVNIGCATERGRHVRAKDRQIASPGRGARAAAKAPPVVGSVLRSPGAPLGTAARSLMETRLGFDFGRVRIHADAAADASARAVGARAYAVGEDIVFARGAYAPDRSDGRWLLAHELGHVVQGRRVPAQQAVLRRQTPQDAGPAPDKWDRIAKEVFGRDSYDDYVAHLTSTKFFGQDIGNIAAEYVKVLKDVETKLKASQPAGYAPPRAQSTLRPRSGGMHAWGMAIDFDVLRNPYVLNEAGDADVDKETLPAYDHIAQFMLNEPQSALRKLKGGRAAFGGGTVGEVYDALKRESDAMRRYFAMKDDRNAVIAFIAGDYYAMHPNDPSPSPDETMAQMKQDYVALGGKDAAGKKAPPPGGKGDRPFAPTSGGGQGDPATGFLNLDKPFVLAMTDAGIAWGAIDIAGAPGDVQHFDLRKIGTGAQVYGKLMASR